LNSARRRQKSATTTSLTPLPPAACPPPAYGTTMMMYGLIEDPLDSPDFDPIAFINQHFPTESSLDGLDTFVVGIASQITTLDEEISSAVQAQSVAGKQASKDIEEAQQAILELFDKIQDIKAKASQSERMVNEICHDIKKLDCAKTHLQASITSLKRLQMLLTAVDQLELLAQEYQYREAANLLDAVKQLMTHFDRYDAVPLIAETKDRVASIQTDLRKHVQRTFRDISQLLDTVAVGTDGTLPSVLAELPGNMKHLSESCLVVDALGPTARRELLEEFVTHQLHPYDGLFAADKPHGTLDQVERRWAWFRRLLKAVDAKFSSVCPVHWRVPLRLCHEFAERTKVHLVAILTALESRDAMDVHALLKALQTTLRFEQEMATRFGVGSNGATATTVSGVPSSASSASSSAVSTPSPFPAAVSASSSSSAAVVARAENETEKRLKSQDKLMYVPTDHGAALDEDEIEAAFLRAAQESIAGGMSRVFDKFMGSYVLLERQNLEEMLQKLSQEEDTASSGDDTGGAGTVYGNVYSSSTSMFVFIKNSIKRCTALSNGTTFLSLCKEFQRCLQQYCDMLRARCPTPITLLNSSPFFNIQATMGQMSIGGLPAAVGNSVVSGGGGTSQVTYRLPAGAETPLCYLINTGEYCAEVVPQLEGLIKQKMAPVLADRVDLSPEVDMFMDLVAHALKILVAGALDRLEPSFRAMVATNWSGSNMVGEESPYIAQFGAVLVDAMTRIREALSSSYLTNFCSKLATEVLQKYLDVIMRQKRISESGSQQLLLDAYTIKTLLLQLHSLDASTAVHKGGGGGSGSGGGSGAGAAAAGPGASDAGASGANGTGKPAAAPAMFVKLVTSKVGHIETILKLVGTPEGTFVERFKIMWPEGTAADLQALMQLKGMKKSDQQAMLDALGDKLGRSGGGGGGAPSSSSHAGGSGMHSMASSSSQYYAAEMSAGPPGTGSFTSSAAAASLLASASAASSASSGPGGGGVGMTSGIAASASSYTAASVKNLGDLSSTAAQNIKSVMGNLVNPRR